MPNSGLLRQSLSSSINRSLISNNFQNLRGYNLCRLFKEPHTTVSILIKQKCNSYDKTRVSSFTAQHQIDPMKNPYKPYPKPTPVPKKHATKPPRREEKPAAPDGIRKWRRERWINRSPREREREKERKGEGGVAFPAASASAASRRGG